MRTAKASPAVITTKRVVYDGLVIAQCPKCEQPYYSYSEEDALDSYKHHICAKDLPDSGLDRKLDEFIARKRPVIAKRTDGDERGLRVLPTTSKKAEQAEVAGDEALLRLIPPAEILAYLKYRYSPPPRTESSRVASPSHRKEDT